MDSSAIAMMKSLVTELRDKDLDIYFTGVIGPLRDTLAQSNFTQQLGQDHFFMSVQEAIDHHDQKGDSNDQNSNESFILQTNTE